MSTTPGTVLVVDDDEDLRALLKAALARLGHRVLTAPNATEARETIRGGEIDVVLSDVRMPGEDGLSLCRHLVATHPDVPVVILTAFGTLEAAVEALRLGAFDFLTKPVELDVLRLAIGRALAHRRLHRRIHVLEGRDELYGDSTPMRELRDLVARVAPHDATVLVLGESGTGKELVARSLHRLRGRSGEFVAVNCAAMPDTLLESELFGHVKGAFTDARSDRAGLFVRAQGGTLFLDEVGELPLALQAKLLRVLQERTVRPVGAVAEVPFDARLVAATNRDLGQLVREGRFREDLFYRLQVVALEVPPLRVRGRDVLELADRFRRELAESYGKPVRAFAPEVAARLLAHSWPGNVRELRNVVERSIALARGDTITLDDLPPGLKDAPASAPAVFGSDDLVSMDEIEARYVRHVMERVDGNKSSAARVLGFDRKTLYRKLERYGIASSDD
ncbi:MAG: sigma-54-dependent Fis family transcriptional regulator [Sandaracinus sp.]|nr:sigma-54-dependent Fis family transcriptional regulator [Sandaracinus sp.]